MTDTKEIMRRISALRARLDEVKRRPADTEPAQALPTDGERQTLVLENRVATGAWHGALIDEELRQISGAGSTVPQLPPKLTARGARVLQRGRELLQQLRDMLEDPLLRGSEVDPLTTLHVEIASMLDVQLRTVQAFPPSASAQLRLCAGLEAVQRVIEERLMVLHAALTHRRREAGRIDALAETFRDLAAERAIDPRGMLLLAEDVAREALANEPLRILAAPASDPPRFVAAHSITVAQVMARLLQGDPEWSDRLPEALFAALVHDVGMVRVPAEILAHPGPLSDEQRRIVERHTHAGAGIVSKIMPGGGIFVEGAETHHERMDGTGYPAGRRESHLSSYARALAICDVYAALAAPRPHRPARDSRTALTDTLLLADQGALDRTQAEKLLGLSFYPIGSVVELSDGAVGYVIATLPGRQSIDNPGKPILSLLAGAGGQALAVPRLVNLLEDGRSIVRTLPARERLKLLLGRHPELI